MLSALAGFIAFSSFSIPYNGSLMILQKVLVENAILFCQIRHLQYQESWILAPGHSKGKPFAYGSLHMQIFRVILLVHTIFLFWSGNIFERP